MICNVLTFRSFHYTTTPSGSVTGWSLSWFAAVPRLVIKHVFCFFFLFFLWGIFFCHFINLLWSISGCQINMWKSYPQNSTWTMTEIILKSFLKRVQTQMIRCCLLSRLLFSLCLCSVLFWSCVFLCQGSNRHCKLD